MTEFCSKCGQSGYHLPPDIDFNNEFIPNKYTLINGTLICQNCWKEDKK